MAELTEDLGRRLKRVPDELQPEFPGVPTDAIEHDVDQETRKLIEPARFNDFVPVLVHSSRET